MKLLIICPEPFEKGGIGTYTYNLISGFLSLRHKNIDITLLIRNEKKESIFEKNNNLKLISIHGGLIKWYKEVTSFLLKNYAEFDWIEAPEFGASTYFVSKLSRKVSNKLIIRLHTNTRLIKFFEQKYGIFDKIKTKIMDCMEKYVTSSAKLVTAPSRSIAEIECLMWEIPIEKTKVIPNPIKLPIHTSKFNIVKENFDIDKYVLYFGRLQKRKGILDFIDSIKFVRKNRISFVVVGGDPFNLKDKLKDRLNSNLRKRVVFIDHLPRDIVMRVVKDAEVVVLPSHFESFSYTLVEAMSFGVPVITTPVGGIKEIVHHLENGFLVEPKNPKCMAKWIDYILDEKNSNVINEIRRNAINTAYNFEASKIAQLYLNVLEGIM